MRNTEALIETLAREAGTRKPAPHPLVQCGTWTAWAAIYLTAALLMAGLRPDLLSKLQEPWFVAEIAVLVVLFIATALSTALLSFPDLYQWRRLALAPALGVALLLLTLGFAAQADMAAAPLHSYQCTVCIALMALLPAAWAFSGVRRFASTHYRWAGSLVVLAALSLGALWLRLTEHNDSIAHVIDWHYLPMIGFGLLGLWLGKVILKW